MGFFFGGEFTKFGGTPWRYALCFDNEDWVFLKGSLGKLALVSFLPFLFFVQI